jgi:flagellar biosynthetic protein FliR
MDILSIIKIDPHNWPLAGMMLLRTLTLFFFLPILGDQAVPVRVRIAFGFAFCFFSYPIVSNFLHSKDKILEWNSFSILVTSLREVFFALAIGFSAKLVFFGTSIASHLSGVNMGFQAASMFNPSINEKDSSYALFQNWIVVVLFLTLNVHHIILQEIVKSFVTVPIGPTPASINIAKVTIHVVKEAFLIGIRMSAPILTVQILVNISLGLLNRSLPSLNIFSLNFPLSFLTSFIILFVSISSLIYVIAHYGFESEIIWIQSMKRIFF